MPGLAPAQTKKQRENAAKKAKEDALKREKEEEQERRLKAHRDALQRARYDSFFIFLSFRHIDPNDIRRYRAQEAALAKRPKPSSQNYFGSDPSPVANVKVQGNLHAGLDPTNDGALVWD